MTLSDYHHGERGHLPYVFTKQGVEILFLFMKTKVDSKMDINKYKKQYHNLNIYYCSSFHDHFIILDQKVLCHCGASFKDLGKKCFVINRIEDPTILKHFLHNVSEIT